MNLDELARDAGAELRDQVDTIESPAPGVIARRSRRGRAATGMAGVAILAVAGVGLAVVLQVEPAPTPLQVTQPESTTIPRDALVWYDTRGLHRGGLVEQTPVELVQQHADGGLTGALALVRSGAVYLDPATGDVWFHPWDGEPRIVGHNSAAGPGGDPDGDTAAWFEGSELVVYDTAAGREISRTDQRGRIVVGLTGEHWPVGNGFLQVSAQQVVWTSAQSGEYRLDLRTQTTSEVEVPTDHVLVDVHAGIEVSWTGRGAEAGNVVVRAPDRAEDRYPNLEPRVRFSASGDYFIAVESTNERHGAVIVDTRTGETWPVPRDVYPWIAWSYGDIALVDHTEDALLACDAAHRTCERLQPDGPVLLPTN